MQHLCQDKKDNRKIRVLCTVAKLLLEPQGTCYEARHTDVLQLPELMDMTTSPQPRLEMDHNKCRRKNML